jgi:hypothetical protein
MIRYVRLALIVVPLAVGAALPVRPGRAQTAPTGRFAYADTTLLRDTLNLRFEGLFELADSLGIPPDSLRAQSIRYRMSLLRLVQAADSMRVPVDSVGVVLLRERMNPLTAGNVRSTRFQYSSSYMLSRNNSTWTNFGDLGLVRGSVYLNSQTSIDLSRQQAGGLNLNQGRVSDTEAGWRFSPNFSLGARALLERNDGVSPGGLNDFSDNTTNLQFTSRTKQRPARGWTSEINFLSGFIDQDQLDLVKTGITGDLNGKIRYQRDWLTHDVSGRFSGNLARSKSPQAIDRIATQDLSNQLDGTLALLTDSPAGLNVNYGIKRSRIESLSLPDSNGNRFVQPNVTDNDQLNMTLRFRQDNDRFLTVSERLGHTSRQTATYSSQNEVSSQAFNITGRYRAGGWFLDTSFDNSFSNSKFPRRAAAGGYGDRASTRLVQATATRTFGGKFLVKGEGRVSLSQNRYYLIGTYPTLPADRDRYQQRYRLDGDYNRSDKFSTGVWLEVLRTHFINLPSASTGSNNETRTYRAEWHWTYRLLRALTATQSNRLSADYLFYDFLPTNNRLSLTYNIRTTLNALLTPRTTLQFTHVAESLPKGNYVLFLDGVEYFTKSDEVNNYTLAAQFSYAPSSVLSFNIQTDYSANERIANTSDGLQPEREDNKLNFSGGGTLNLPLGAKGNLSGTIRRTYWASRSTDFQGGIAGPPGRTGDDYWNGRLELTWNL